MPKSAKISMFLGAIISVGVINSYPVHAQATIQAAEDSQVQNCLPKSWFDPPPSYKSVEILPDGRVTFRICAPLANDVNVISSDLHDIIPQGMVDGVTLGQPMVQDATGLWSVTTNIAVPADTYRFNFQVDGSPVPDPRGTDWSENANGLTSVFEVPGDAGTFQSFNSAIPHGSVTEVEYWSSALSVKRRAHVYTPPGYMKGAMDYPVLYLVHGAGDNDDSWTSIGHAHYILDNLIAEGKAKPMIVVMPAGHTPYRADQHMLRNDDFGADLTQDLIPFIDREYRTIPNPESRAMAGLSMGGAHTLNFGLTRPDLFQYVGIFSMGLGLISPEEIAEFEGSNAENLAQSADSMALVYYAMGKTDFLYDTVAPTRAMMDRHGIRHTYVESEGGHTWVNWRHYFHDFAPKLFQ